MATLKDVAKASGLTVGTVSRVLNNRGYISDKTREKVYQVMKELNYQPNEMARSLSKQKSNTIGIILPNIEHPYFAKVLSRLEREAAKQDYRIMLFVSVTRKSGKSSVLRCARAEGLPELYSAAEALRRRSLRALISRLSHWSVPWTRGLLELNVITTREGLWLQSFSSVRDAVN